MKSTLLRSRVLLGLSFVAVVSAVAFLKTRTEPSTPASVPPAVAPAADSTVDAKPAQATPAAVPEAEAAPVPEGQRGEFAVRKAELFESLISEGVVSGGEVLVRAFDIHDSCMGIPRSQRGLEEWYADNASVSDVDYDTMERRTQDCIGVPALTFDTRRRMLQPLADSTVEAAFWTNLTFAQTSAPENVWTPQSVKKAWT